LVVSQLIDIGIFFPVKENNFWITFHVIIKLIVLPKNLFPSSAKLQRHLIEQKNLENDQKYLEINGIV
jgi:hypothetical protein